MRLLDFRAVLGIFVDIKGNKNFRKLLWNNIPRPCGSRSGGDEKNTSGENSYVAHELKAPVVRWR